MEVTNDSDYQCYMNNQVLLYAEDYVLGIREGQNHGVRI
jgi:hypothetical protein